MYINFRVEKQCVISGTKCLESERENRRKLYDSSILLCWSLTSTEKIF